MELQQHTNGDGTGGEPAFTSVFPVPGTAINGLTTAYFSAPAGIKLNVRLDGVTNFFWVGRQAAQGINEIFLLGDNVNYNWHGNGLLGYIGGFAGQGLQDASATVFANGTSTTNSFKNISVLSSSTVFIMSVHGITGNTRFQGLCYDRTYHAGWLGDFGELICYNSALTNNQITAVETYLRNKWNI